MLWRAMVRRVVCRIMVWFYVCGTLWSLWALAAGVFGYFPALCRILRHFQTYLSHVMRHRYQRDLCFHFS